MDGALSLAAGRGHRYLHPVVLTVLDFWVHGCRQLARPGRPHPDISGQPRKNPAENCLEVGIGKRLPRNFEDLLVRVQIISACIYWRHRQLRFKRIGPLRAQIPGGMHAQAYEIGLEESWEKARHDMREKTRQDCRSQASTSKIRNFSMQLDFQDETWRYILLPAYINTYFYENKPFQVLINGQTGVIAGQRPADWRKIGRGCRRANQLPGILILPYPVIRLPATFEDGGAVLSFFIFVVGLVISVVIAMRAQKLDKI